MVPAEGGITWVNASLAATNRGGYLATITSAKENEFVFKLAEQNSAVWYNGYGPWLGGIQPAGADEPTGGWAWITGEPFTYKNWAPGQPNNNQYEDRIHFGGQANRSSMWNDVGRNTVNFTRGFIVEHNQHPNVVTLSILRKDADEVQLSWASRLNVHYTIQWTEHLGGQWNVLPTVIGNDDTLTMDDLLAGRSRFYRCVVSP
ncbi:MAG: lectin-like protein [Verrucomicrobiales bacterium]